MRTRILRFERGTDSSGNEEIFMLVEVNTGTLLLSRAEWLIPEDIALINLDEATNKSVIADEIADRAIIVHNMNNSN
jgi:hypothetical protein